MGPKKKGRTKSDPVRYDGDQTRHQARDLRITDLERAQPNTDNIPSRFSQYSRFLLPLLTIHSTLYAPLNCAFKIGDVSMWVLIGIELVFLIDIIRESRSVIDNMNLNPAEHWIWKYLKHLLKHPRLLFEIIAFTVWAFQWKHESWFKIVRVLRLKDAWEEIKQLEVVRDHPFTDFVSPVSVHVYSTHIVSCLFFNLARTSLDKNHRTWVTDMRFGNRDFSQLGKVEQYGVSFYFAAITISTLGFGDIHAVNIDEMMTLAFLQIFTALLLAYLSYAYTNLIKKMAGITKK